MRLRLIPLLIAFGAALPFAASAQAWTSLTSGVTNDLNNLACVDARTCYAVGGAPFIGGPGIVLKTTDAGATWVSQTIPVTNPLRGISCPTATTCYVAGDGGVILKTADGGTTWTRQSVPNLTTFPGQAQPWFWDVWATSTTTAVAVGNTGAIYRTTNGGETWTQIVAGAEDQNLHGVFFTNPTTGWVLGGGIVLKTADGGTSWIRQTPADLSPFGWDAFSFDGTNVWISGGTVHKSTDGGATWVRQVAPLVTYRGIEFTDASNGWIVGALTQRTINGGMTWTIVSMPTSQTLRDIQCVGADLCYAVGDDGTILRYGTPSPAPQPDLVVSDRTLTCPAGELGLEFAEYRYRVVATNSGTAASGPFTVRIEGVNAAGASVGTPINRTIADLAAGASTTIEGQANVGLLNPTAAATATIRITADVLGQVTESNEANNAGTIEQTCTTAASTVSVPTPTPAISPTPAPTTATPVTPPSTAETTPPTTAAPTPTTIATPPTTATEPTPTTTSPAATTPPSTPVVEHPVAAVPTAVEKPTATPLVPPEEKRAMEEAARRVQLELITREAPKVLLGVERFAQEKGIVRSDALEVLASQKVQAIAETKLPELPTQKATEVRSALTTFIAYGTEPTVKLGAGERAGVVDSYKTAFGKLPETQQDWEDVMKIAVGRFPSQTKPEREQIAEDLFKKIYRRAPVRTQPNDSACVAIVAYGLRPETRRFAAESTAIKTFKSVFKKGPKSAGDWDTIRCIAYSGAKR
jgi:photosystem II stability/assembly factor-like uncharacterized protein